MKRIKWSMAMWIAALSQGCVTTSGELGGVEDSEGTSAGDSGGQDDEGNSGTGMVETGDTGDDGSVMQCDYDAGPSPVSLITRRQYEHATRDLLQANWLIWSNDELWAFLDDYRMGPFPGAWSGIPNEADGFAQVAAEVVQWVNPSVVLPCDLPAANPGQCAEDFVVNMGRSIWRRPLTSVEVETLLGHFDGVDLETGMAAALIEMLSSESFTHIEMTGSPLPEDPGVLVLDDWSRATRLSFFLWNSAPDEQLLNQAEAGSLSEPEVLHAEAERMLADPRARRMVGDYYTSLLDVEDLADVAKDPVAFPEFESNWLLSMAFEVREFTAEAVLGSEGDMETLLSAPFTFVDHRLVQVYGGDIASTDGDPDLELFVRAELDPEHRGGMLSLPGVMAMHSYEAELGFTHRGKMVRENLLCQIIPPPPPGIDMLTEFPEPPFDRYELHQQHAEEPACWACHVMMDEISFAFDNYDALGQWQDEIHGFPVDATGEVEAIDPGAATFDGRGELVEVLLGSEALHDCAVRQWMLFALRREIQPEGFDQCTWDVVRERFAQSDGNLRTLLLDIVDSSAFISARYE